jgi:hypothetical protein
MQNKLPVPVSVQGDGQRARDGSSVGADGDGADPIRSRTTGPSIAAVGWEETRQDPQTASDCVCLLLSWFLSGLWTGIGRKIDCALGEQGSRNSGTRKRPRSKQGIRQSAAHPFQMFQK